MKITEKYIAGFTTGKEALRKYECEIKDGEHKGKRYFKEIHTKRNKNGEWKNGKSYFYTDDSKIYENIEDLIKIL